MMWLIHRSVRTPAMRGSQRLVAHLSTAAAAAPRSVSVNSVAYALPQPRPLVALLIDGGSQEYLAAASAAGATPFLDSLLRASTPGSFGGAGSARGTHALVSGQIPTLTNPNNVAIVCGAPASTTGICGNYFLDESEVANGGEPVERLMNSVEFLRAPTVFAEMQKQAGMQLTIVDTHHSRAHGTGGLTAKDKLLSLLSAGLDKSSPLTLAFSIEKLGAAAAAEASGKAVTAANAADLTPQERMVQHRGVTLRELSEPFYTYFELRPDLLASCTEAQRRCIAERQVPDIYNPHISLYLLELGLQLLKADLARDQARAAAAAASSSGAAVAAAAIPPRMYYLSTTDYVQHKFLPNDVEAVRFYAYIDSVMQRLDATGAVVAATADHGMNSKVGFDGQPRVVFLQSELDRAGIANRVVLPITDPYVKHHSSLGGYATVYLADKDPAAVMRAMLLLRKVPGIYTVLNRAEAAKAFELPADRLGDVVVLGDQSTVLGKRPEDHDLQQVPHLRSHGSMDEATVPMIINRRLKEAYSKRMTTGKTRNWHLLDMMFNGVQQ